MDSNLLAVVIANVAMFFCFIAIMFAFGAHLINKISRLESDMRQWIRELKEFIREKGQHK